MAKSLFLHSGERLVEPVRKLTSALRAAARLPLLSPAIRELYFWQQLAAHRKLIKPYKVRRRSTARIVRAPLLIGYFETGFGLGEHVKGLAAALDAVGAPFAAYPYNSFTGRPRDEAPWAARYDVNDVHDVNILCMAADQTANARRIVGRRLTDSSYNILIPPWELPHAPESWRADLNFFDELWAESRFVADAFRPLFSKRILLVPPCVHLNANPQPDRHAFNLDPHRFYFFFSFDFNSRPQRKNPGAVVRAFELAFGERRDNVGLIFKISGASDRFPNENGELEAACRRNPRIAILRGIWKRNDMLALLACTDCYVSLHRSEGFGIGLAEAMALGKPVIATGFSGNADFLTAQTGYPVPYQLRPVASAEYPHFAGNFWAEPDVGAAAELMRRVFENRDEARSRALQGQAYVQRHFGVNAIGELAAAQLRDIGSERALIEQD